MDGEHFYGHLTAIVGAQNASLYASRFGGLDDIQHGSILNFEALAFYVYTTSMNWHDHINEQLWAGNPGTEIRAFCDVLNSALQKLPAFKTNGGVVYRGYKTADVDAFLEPYRPGEMVHFRGFTSASIKEDQAFGGNILFIIRALTARAVWFLSANFHECEVLIPAGRHFTVANVMRDQGRAIISLEELE
ncbi:hypothetical protein GA830_07485 [Mesorhizobium sp. NBSH29]|uniref:ADP-ribosyltransferase domain-containing protein n=1 Tax=Mesorhizobium sp. NBSH29 TaxID=2654249 RepID=UPI0018968B7A|nr:ADP-ribosyltransferase domain-containing protein [Mesorhizobium sp. NBSH29]QPC86594.1 hypothetical protein GA830_07485 [Mesorhizobium sp. NBSH29]